MGNARIFTVGILALIAALGISAVIVALAPYVACVVVVMGVCWYALGKDDASSTDPPSTLDTPNVPTVKGPQERS